MLFSVTSKKKLEEIEAGLNAAAESHRFGILTIHDLKETMRKKGVDFGGECRIYEVCNPQQAKKVLEADGAVSTALPCRISVYRDGNEYRIATLLPTKLMTIFGNPDLQPVAAEVEAVLKAMIQEAA